MAAISEGQSVQHVATRAQIDAPIGAESPLREHHARFQQPSVIVSESCVNFDTTFGNIDNDLQDKLGEQRGDCGRRA